MKLSVAEEAVEYLAKAAGLVKSASGAVQQYEQAKKLLKDWGVHFEEHGADDKVTGNRRTWKP